MFNLRKKNILYYIILCYKKNRITKKISKYSRNNRILVDPTILPHLRLKIDGKNNSIIIKKTSKNISGVLDIELAGTNCNIEIDEDFGCSQGLKIVAGFNHPNFGLIENLKIHIAKNNSFENVKIVTYNSNSSISIKDNCMFSFGITIYHTDGHPIIDKNSKRILNRVKDLSIGKHCWIGANATILKNVEIGDNSIVGWGSVVGRGFSRNIKSDHIPTNCVITGNPAKIVKEGITWDSDGSNGYIQNDLT